ncbi:methionine/alanine import family NSS transporter small subunit [Acinetobacter haemolyticus]
MNSSALIMMIVAITLVWGGLALSIIHLMRHPEQKDDSV